MIEQIERDDILIVHTMREAWEYPMFRNRQVVSSLSRHALLGRRFSRAYVTLLAPRSPRWEELHQELKRIQRVYSAGAPIAYGVEPASFASVKV